jgi:hypothetical protein
MTLICDDCKGGMRQSKIPPIDYTVDISIPGGYYNSVKDVCSQLNDSLKKTFSSLIVQLYTDNGRGSSDLIERSDGDALSPYFRYNETERRVNCTLPINMTIRFSKEMATLLGFGDKQNPLINDSNDISFVDGNQVSDINVGIHGLYVYCDVLEMTPLGDSLVPLLRIVTVPEQKHGTMVNVIYENIRYVPLQKKHFDSIEIDIRDCFGEKIAFENGQLVATLHFRRSRNPYFLP